MKRQVTFYELGPWSKNPTLATDKPCTGLPLASFGAFNFGPEKNPLNFGEFSLAKNSVVFDRRRQNILRNILFMVNMAFNEENFGGDFDQLLSQGIDELVLIKLWKENATTEVKWNKLIANIALAHFPQLTRDRLQLSQTEFRGTVGRQRIGLNPAVPSTTLFQWMADLAFRLGNVPLLELPEEDFKEIAFYEFAAAPVYPEFEFQLVNDHKRGSDNAS